MSIQISSAIAAEIRRKGAEYQHLFIETLVRAKKMDQDRLKSEVTTLNRRLSVLGRLVERINIKKMAYQSQIQK